MECNHNLGLDSTQTTYKVDRDFYYKKCTVCKEKQKLPRANRIYVGVSIAAETIKDFERREYAKDLLQGWNIDGSKNELFEEAYGDPIKKGKAKKGGKLDKLQIKDKKKK